MINGRFVVFINHPNRLYEILRYVNRNETGWNIVLVHCGNKKTFKEIEELLPKLTEAGVFPHFNITLVYKNAEFGPALIDKVSEEFDVRKNRIMIGSIHHFHKFDYEELGGVRIIF